MEASAAEYREWLFKGSQFHNVNGGPNDRDEGVAGSNPAAPTNFLGERNSVSPLNSQHRHLGRRPTPSPPKLSSEPIKKACNRLPA